MRSIVGVDLGGTKIATALVLEDGTITAFDSRPTDAQEGQAAVMDRMEAGVRAVLGQAGLAPSGLLGLGIGAPGPVDRRTGVVTQPPNLPGWHDVPLKAIFERRLGVPTFVGNDANVAALAEHRFGAGVGVENMIYVTVSTGIGGGFVLNGRLYAGSDGAAAEVGHMVVDEGSHRCNCGNIGCWEAIASGTALARDAVARIANGEASSIARIARESGAPVSAQIVYQAALEGDALARDLIANTAHYLGVGLMNLVHLLNPDVIVVGGGMARMGDMLLEPARQVIRARGMELATRRARIIASALGDRVGVLGAAAQVLEETEQ